MNYKKNILINEEYNIISESIEENNINTKNTSNFIFEDGIMYENSEELELKNYSSIFNVNFEIEEKSQQSNVNIEGKNNKGEFNDIPFYFREDTKREKTFLGKKHLKENSINYSKIMLVKDNDCQKFIKKNKIFDINKILIYRLDYYIKAFKTYILKYFLNKLRTLFDKCTFNEFKNTKFHMPNYSKYQGNTKEKDNKEFINKTIKEVFMDIDMDYDEKDNKKIGISRQKENKILIDNIYKINNFPYTKEQKKLKDFLEMTIQKGIEEYYVSSEFEEFKKKEK